MTLKLSTTRWRIFILKPRTQCITSRLTKVVISLFWSRMATLDKLQPKADIYSGSGSVHHLLGKEEEGGCLCVCVCICVSVAGAFFDSVTRLCVTHSVLRELGTSCDGCRMRDISTLMNGSDSWFVVVSQYCCCCSSHTHFHDKPGLHDVFQIRALTHIISTSTIVRTELSEWRPYYFLSSSPLYIILSPWSVILFSSSGIVVKLLFSGSSWHSYLSDR